MEARIPARAPPHNGPYAFTDGNGKMDLWTPLRRTLIPMALLLAGCATSGQTAPDAEEAAIPASTPTTAGSREDAQRRFVQGVALARQGDTEQAIALFEDLTRQLIRQQT